MKKILCFFGIHDYGLAKCAQSLQPYVDCNHCSKWLPFTNHNIPHKFIILRIPDNGSYIRILNFFTEHNAYDDFEGVFNLCENSTAEIKNETSTLYLTFKTKNFVYVMDGIVYITK
jgi:hypothetical protein